MVIFWGALAIYDSSRLVATDITHDVTFVPLFATSLFSTHKFAMEYMGPSLKVLESPERRRIGSHTVSVEFTATIRTFHYSRPLVVHLLLIYYSFSTLGHTIRRAIQECVCSGEGWRCTQTSRRKAEQNLTFVLPTYSKGGA